ncbi:MAG TPA: SDR family oxidoreductase, partial [Candidatus Limnocylindria bacterium]|nr:SDR family oxidoreductase [Candidatus Limnocylindria bacterium]
VTGASRGLGLEIARQLLDAGCAVAFCARDAAEVERAEAELLQGAPAGGRVLGIACDVGVAEDVETFIAQVEQELGQVEIVVNCAATIQVGGIETMDLPHFDAAMRDSYYGALHTTLAVLPGMQQRGEGRIVNISSIGGRVAMPHLLPYTAGKFALTGFSEGLRAELAGEGIAVTTVVPSLMRTGSFLASDFHPPAAEEYAWFSGMASAPLISVAPQTAARRILRAMRHGEGDVTIGWFAQLGGLIHGAASGLTADVLSYVDRWMLPHPASGEAQVGHQLQSSAPEPIRIVSDPVVDSGVREFHEPPPAAG